MPELRLTLMVVGGIFLIGLAWWELRRSHQVRGSDLPPPPDPPERPFERSADWDLPPLELPRMSARDPEAQLPVVEVDPEEFAQLQAGAETTVPADLGGVEGLLDELGASQFPDPPISDLTDQVTLAREPAQEPEQELPQELPPAPLSAPAAALLSVADPAPAPVVAQLAASQASEVLAVRLVSTGEKFSGRAVRMALAAEGFTIGKFSIFHRAAADGRALLSIASLNKPGTFDRHSIDMQRYSGLNLFTVLPGPVPAREALDELLACAQLLARRLRASLQDGEGAPLTPSRTAAMRNAAAAAPT